MGAFFVYILKSALTLALLYAVYCLALRRETFHAFNRVVLVLIVAVSLVVPAIPFSTSHPTVVNEGIARVETLLTGADEAEAAQDVAAGEPKIKVTVADATSSSPETAETTGRRAWWPLAIVALYIIGVVVALGRYAFQIVRLALRLHRLKGWRLESGARIVRTDEPIEGSPFSWGRTVVVSRKDLDDNARAILAHEFAHVRLRHSLDRTLCEVVACLQWFNPFARMLTADLCTVHEYQADRAALRRTPSAEAYSLMLIRKATTMNVQPVVSSLSRSSVKRRMVMMFTAPSRRSRAARALYLVPLIVCTVAAYARPELAEEMPELPFATNFSTIQQPNEATISLIENGENRLSATRNEQTTAKATESAEDEIFFADNVHHTRSYAVDANGEIIINYQLGDDKHDLKAGNIASMAGDTIVYYNGRRLSSRSFAQLFGSGNTARNRLFQHRQIRKEAALGFSSPAGKHYKLNFASVPPEVVHDLTGEEADVCIIFGEQPTQVEKSNEPQATYYLYGSEQTDDSSASNEAEGKTLSSSSHS